MLLSWHALCFSLAHVLIDERLTGMVLAMIEQQSCIAEMLRDLERQIGNALQEEILLDLAEIPVISSYFVNELIRINLRLRMTERRLRLVNVQPTVCELLKLLRLDRIFDYEPINICDKNEQASPVIKQRSDAPQKPSSFFLRKFASHFALRSIQ